MFFYIIGKILHSFTQNLLKIARPWGFLGTPPSLPTILVRKKKYFFVAEKTDLLR